MLRLERQRVTGLVGSEPELPRYGDHCVAVDAISSYGSQLFRQRIGLRLACVAGALVPEHYRKENANVVAMEISDHLTDTVNSPGHVVKEIELVSVVDAHVRIRWPDEHGINAAESFVEIVEIAVDSVFAGDWIVKIAILNHHLRLHVAALRPFQFRTLIFTAVVADSLELLCPPTFHPGEPCIEVGRLCWAINQLTRSVHRGILCPRFYRGQPKKHS